MRGVAVLASVLLRAQETEISVASWAYGPFGAPQSLMRGAYCDRLCCDVGWLVGWYVIAWSRS